MTTPTPKASPFFLLLPPELRLKIYTHALPSNLRLKLLHHLPSSLPSLSVLRASHQTYSEALPILYENNTILCTRNDFCPRVSPELKTPIRLDMVRWLEFVAFHRSIPCALAGAEEGRCAVCRGDVGGLVRIFVRGMGRLRRVVVRCARVREVGRALGEWLREMGWDVFVVSCDHVGGQGGFCLRGPGVAGREIVFVEQEA